MREPYLPERILLTGATGTIGRLVLPALASIGAPIRALQHRTALAADVPRIEEVRHGDLARPESIRGLADDCDVVVHAAGQGHESLDRERARRVNVEGTRAVLREAQSARSKVFLLLGYTGTVQERSDQTLSVNEETPPDAEYELESVRSMYEAEAMVLEANRTGGLRTMVVSPGAILSPGIPTMLGGVVSAFLKRELPYRLLDDVWLAISDGNDVGRCARSAVSLGRGGRRYFATGECVRWGDLYERLERVSGVPAPRRRIPDLLVEELGLLAPVLPPHSFLRQVVFPRELVLHLKRLAPVSNARTREDLAFEPAPLDDLLAAFARAEGLLVGRAAGVAG